jgi:hypothetical protein
MSTVVDVAFGGIRNVSTYELFAFSAHISPSQCALRCAPDFRLFARATCANLIVYNFERNRAGITRQTERMSHVGACE